MKVLILSPLYEQNVPEVTALHRELYNIFQDKMTTVYEMGMYADYLINNKIAKNWEYAVVYAIKTEEKFYNENQDNNLVVIGNAPKNQKFDLIISYNIDEAIPYEDKMLNIINKMNIDNISNEYYSDKDVNLHCKNAIATAKLITSYLGVK